ncbi:MFS transporter [Streptomyces sp. NPDC058001]|uniref:MFS transporter n=1 Tax=Streptomyces sp. NPDC058001 TaxID=3346300 RepID=UPI0036E0464E
MTESPHTAPRATSTADRGWTPRLVWSTIFMALVLEALGLGATMVSIGLPSILKEFPTTQGGWLTTAYFLAGAVSAPLLGKAADLYGKRRILLLTMLVSGVGAMLCALAPSFGVLLVGRALQGPILATLSLVPSLIRDTYPPKRAVVASAVTITGLGFFSVFTPLLVGKLIETTGFRGMFWFDAVWTFALCVAIWLVAPESPLRRSTHLDILGGTLLSAGVLAVLLYVSMGHAWGWTSTAGLLLVLGGAILLVLFYHRAHRTEEPIVNLALFRRRPLLFVAIGGATGYGISITISQVVPMLAMTPRAAGETYGLGYSTYRYATLGTPQAIATVAAGMVVGLLVARGRHPRLFLTIGLLAWPVATMLLAYRNDSFLELAVAALVVGVAGGLVTASVPNLVMRATPADDQGSTAGTVQLCQTGFSAVTPVVMFAVLAPHAKVFPGGGVVYGETGFRTWLLVTAVLAIVIAAIGATLLRERPDQDVQEFALDAASPLSERAGKAAPSVGPLESPNG